MQKIAKQREELLRQRAAAEQHVAQCDAELIALHEKANLERVLYPNDKERANSQVTHIILALLFVNLSESPLSGPYTPINSR